MKICSVLFPDLLLLYEGLNSASLLIWFSCFAVFAISFMCVFFPCITEVEEIGWTAHRHFYCFDEDACAFHILRPANENRSKSNKPDVSDLLLETNSIANTIALLTYVVFSSILQNNRSWHQIVRLLNVSAFPVKARLTKVGCSRKITDPLFCCTHPICKASISSFIILESYCSFDFRFISGWLKTKLWCSSTQ